MNANIAIIAAVTVASTGAELLAAYNVRAIATGNKPLASFKISKQALLDKLNALPPMPAADAAEFSVTAFAAERGVEAKSARAALRKAGFAAPYADTTAIREIIMAIKPRAKA